MRCETLRVLTRVLAVQMGKEGHISETCCRKNLQAAERGLGREPGGGAGRSRCPGDTVERGWRWWDGGAGGWRVGEGMCGAIRGTGSCQRDRRKTGSRVFAGHKPMAAHPQDDERLQSLMQVGNGSPAETWETQKHIPKTSINEAFWFWGMRIHPKPCQADWDVQRCCVSLFIPLHRCRGQCPT